MRQGLGYGVAAYLIWGLFPLYWPLLEPAGSVEMLAHRVVWSLLALGVLVPVLRRGRHFSALLRDRRRRRYLALAAVVISVNWGMYIYGVTHERVVEAALGYYINPLVTVLMGVVVFRERLRPLQWAALALAAVAVAVLTLEYGRLPWVALTLAFSFGTYGLAKKKADAGAVESLAVETMLVAPFATAYLVWLALAGQITFGTTGLGHGLLFVTAGLVTAVPLLCFGAAATRLPMVGIGLLQYLTPSIQFVLGVFLLGEAMPAARWAGFGLVWAALVIFTWESLHHRRRQLRLAAEAAAV